VAFFLTVCTEIDIYGMPNLKLFLHIWLYEYLQDDSYCRVNVKELLLLFSSLPYLFYCYLKKTTQFFKVLCQPGLTKIQALFYGW
jgi:hypothetical protein